MLTEPGIATWPSLYALSRWGERYAPADRRSGRSFAHYPCDTVIDDHGRCPRCDIIPGPADLVTLPGPSSEADRSDPVSVLLRQPHRLLTPLIPAV